MNQQDNMKKHMNKVPVVFIADDNFAVPTAVAVVSLIENKNEDTFYDIYIFCIEVALKNIEALKEISAENVSINILDFTNKYDSLNISHPHVSRAALFKFDIPNLLPEFEKILYLDGDILVKKDLSALFALNIDQFYVAATRDMVGEKKLNLHKIVGVEKYFNSGVMLLNLKKMRLDDVTNKLLSTRKEKPEFKTMDQDVFNHVFNENVLWLEPKYNAMIFNLIQSDYSVEQINDFFQTEYVNFDAILEDAAVIHLTNSKKPWLNKFSFMNNEWFKYFKKTTFINFSDIQKNEAVKSEAEIHSLRMAFDLEQARAEIEAVDSELAAAREALRLKESELVATYASREWKAALMLRKLIGMLIPKGSPRRKIAVICWKYVKILLRLLLRTVRMVKNVMLPCKYFILKSLKTKRPRKINKNSRKIAYIGHSYHNKTKSTAFLIDYLKEFYDVEVVLDESWRGQGEAYPDLSFIDESFLGVIFFQNLPSGDILKKIKNDNIIFFPMYDGVPHDMAFWGAHYGLKVINFSRTLHEKLTLWGLDSINVQYFPKPLAFIPGKKEELFFWQRITRLNIKVIAKLFEKENLKIHIHKAIDPQHQFVQPSIVEEKKFDVTYSDWFETRDEMWDMVKQKGLYVAPRELEGIGMSFLEAMAMGKAVVAVNNPTMNEYIEHEKSGYLFELKNPKRIDLSDVEQVQKNAYEFMQKGHEKWEKDKHKIIEFIERS